ncbi:MAG TPA: hypothetical protein VLV81_08155 [Acidimicrobiia bacterium]|nr:hypothetical protein [Acidimicrobiia bacterium]
MLLWYTGLSILIIANVFRSTGLDYRLVAAGALLPLLVDLPIGHRAVGHALVFPVALFVAVMVGTASRSRLLRRRLLCVPIGVFVALVLSGAFTQDHVFLWPFLGGAGDASVLPAWWAVLIEEVVGLAAWWWVVGQFDLYLPGPRRDFWHAGRLREGEP